MKMRTPFLSLIAVAICTAALYAAEPENCKTCKGVFDGGCGGAAHEDGQGTILWKVLFVHSHACRTCYDMHPTDPQECSVSIARMEDATSHRVALPDLSRSAPDLVAYIPGSDYAEVLCEGKVIAVVPVDEKAAAESVRLASSMSPDMPQGSGAP
jgi:hypothetical protein